MTLRKGFAVEPQVWKERGRLVKSLELRWRRVDFLRGSVAQLPTRGGVYAICLKSERYVSSESPWRLWASPMYIGRSGCLRTRFRDHVNGDYETTKRFALSFRGLDFWFAVVEDPVVQQALEANLISMFGPPINRVQPALVPIAGTLGDPIAFSFPTEVESTRVNQGE